MISVLEDIGFGHDLAVLVANVLGVFALGGAGLLWTLLGIWIERKVAGRIQDRLGPNRVGPYGLFQTVADTVKILIKEDIVNEGVDKPVYNLAPILGTLSVILIWAVLPLSDAWIGTDLGIGVLYVIAVGSFGTLSVLMAGWSSNNKYALLSAFRGVAQLISYEIPMVVALMVPVLMAGTMSLQGIVESQHIAYLFAVPVTALIFVISGQAETGRGPFDLLEGESEIVAGFHIEYSGMKFGLFMVTEFLHAFTLSILIAVLFLGGWRIPFVGLETMRDADGAVAALVTIASFVSLMVKSLAAYFVLIWIRLTLPRLRIDHLLNFNWKFLVPVSLANLMVVALLWKIIPDTDRINSFGDALGPTVVLLLINAAFILLVGAALADYGRRDRARIAARIAGADIEAAGD